MVDETKEDQDLLKSRRGRHINLLLLDRFKRSFGSTADKCAQHPFPAHPAVIHCTLEENVVVHPAGIQVNPHGFPGNHTRNFLAVLAHGHRLALLPEIAAQYEARRAEVENTIDVAVTTALALEPAQRTALEAALAQRFGRKVRLAEQVDAALVGGAIVRAGDLVIDGSLQGRLARLEQQISQP